MTITLDDQTTTTAIPRDRFGRYLIPPVDGGKATPHTRVTTLAKVLSDTSNLIKWNGRVLTCGLRDHRELLDRAAGLSFDEPGHKDTLQGIADDAHELAGGNAKADLGTLLHALTEQYDRGEVVTGEHADTIEAYRATIDAAAVSIFPENIERIVVLPDIDGGTAGTFDRLVTIPGHDLPIVADVKTGGLGYAALEISIQLALYAHASTIWDPTTGEHEPMPAVDQDRGLVIHLPPGGPCTLHWVDIATGWRAVDTVLEVREWRRRASRKRDALLTPFTPDRPAGATADGSCSPVVGAPTPAPAGPPDDVTADRRAWIMGRIRAANTAHPDTLAAAYRVARAQHPDLPESLTPDFRDDDIDVLAEVCDAVEREHEEPFGDPDPATVAARTPPRADPPSDAPPARLTRAEHDEGVTYPDPDPHDHMGALQRHLESLPAGVTAQAMAWRDESKRHGIVWDIFGRRTQRALEQMRAVIALAAVCDAAGTDEPARVALGVVLGEETQLAIPVGAYLGNLSIAEATTLTRVADILADGGTVADALAAVH